MLRNEVDEWALAAVLDDAIVQSLALATYERGPTLSSTLYAGASGDLDVDAVRSRTGVEVAVTDHGTWRAPDDSYVSAGAASRW